jgi:hypothetical protein
VVFVVHLELFLFVDAVDAPAALDDALFEHQVAGQLAQLRVLADALGDNVARTFERVLRRRHFLLRADERGGEFAQRLVGGVLIP